MLILHGSLGLGDAVYLWPVVKKYASMRSDICVVTRYPELFASLNCRTIKPEDVIDCHCSARTMTPGTNIFEDTLIMSGITERLPLELKYGGTPRKYPTGKPVCVIRTPSFPVKGDESARCMVPDVKVYQRLINAYCDRVYFVSIGWPVNVKERLETELDLTKIIDLREYISAIDGADIVVSQPGHCVPIAEALGKRLLAIFAADGLKSEEKRYRFTTPRKVLTSKASRWVVDNEPTEKILETFEDLLEDLHAAQQS